MRTLLLPILFGIISLSAVKSAGSTSDLTDKVQKLLSEVEQVKTSSNEGNNRFKELLKSMSERLTKTEAADLFEKWYKENEGMLANDPWIS